MKKYLSLIIALIIAAGMQGYAKGPAPETAAKAQDIINAIEKKDMAALRELVKDRNALNVSVKGKYSDSYTPLIRAITFYDKDNDVKMRLDMINLLIEAGAKVDMTNDSKRTPLMEAASDGNTDIVNILIKAGAKVNVGDDMGITALMRAVQHGYADVAEILIKNRADVKKRDNISGKAGNTAIFYCVDYIYYGRTLNTACFDLLLASGSDPITEIGSLDFSFFGRAIFELRTVKDTDKKNYLEKLLVKSASHILKNKPNYIVPKKGLMGNRTMLMILAEYSQYVSPEVLEAILGEAAQSKADFSLKSSDKKTAFEHLPAVSKSQTVEAQLTNLKLLNVYQLFSKYNAQSGRPYKNAENVIKEKMKQ